MRRQLRYILAPPDPAGRPANKKRNAMSTFVASYLSSPHSGVVAVGYLQPILQHHAANPRARTVIGHECQNCILALPRFVKPLKTPPEVFIELRDHSVVIGNSLWHLRLIRLGILL